MNYKEVSRGLPQEEAVKYATGIDLVRNFVGSLQGKGLLPKRFATVTPAGSSEAPEPIRFAVEIPTVSEEIYRRTREAVEQAGYSFIVPIRSISMQDLITEDEQRGSRRLGYVDDSKRMRATVPPEMEVAINPARFRINGTNGLPINEQKRRIKQEQAILRGQIPEDIRHLVNMGMVDPSTISQVEDKYMDKNNGALLLPDWFARTDVQTVQGNVAFVGRHGPNVRRDVDDWDRGDGDGRVFAASVVVLPRKLAS